MSSVLIGVRIPSNPYDKLLAYANKIHVFNSEVVISALAQYLKCTTNIPPNQRVADLETKVKELQALYS